MTKGWTKLDSGIVDSTLWAENHATIRVWIALLAKCDAGGFARVAIPAMARLCYMEIDEFEEIIAKLCAPDPYSRCQDEEGRRVALVEGGFVVLSYERYRDMKTRAATGAERKAQFDARARAKALVAASNENNESNKVTPDEKQIAEADEKQKSTATATPKTDSATLAFEQFWNAYDHKTGKLAARRAWKTHAKSRPPIEEILAAVERYHASKKWRENIRCNPSTWINQGRWEDEYDTDGGGEAAQYRADQDERARLRDADPEARALRDKTIRECRKEDVEREAEA